jgi:drug/metabolite transporter (DMT)-like permease
VSAGAAGGPARPLLPYLLLLVPPLCWAGNFVVGRAVHGEIPPAALTFWRWAVAGAVLLPIAAADGWRRRAAVRRRWRLLTVLSATGVVGFQYVVYRGLQTTTAINGVLIIATIPVAIPAVAYLLDGARIGRRQTLGIGISLVGAAIVVLKGDPAGLIALELGAGDGWIALAVPMWALYSVLVRRAPADLPPLALLLATVLIGLAILVPLYASELIGGRTFAPTPGVLLSIAYVGVFASVLAFACWNRGVASVGAARAGLFIHLMPVFATLLAMTFLGETLEPYHLAGMALVAAGLFLSSTAPPARGG